MEIFEKNEMPQFRRMPVAVEINGEKKTVWVGYNIEMKEYAGVCNKCGRQENSKIESVKDMKVESDSPSVVKQAEEQLKMIVDTIEREMFVCKDCLDDEFMKNRQELYIEKLEMVQEKLGIEVDKDEQRKKIRETK